MKFVRVASAACLLLFASPVMAVSFPADFIGPNENALGRADAPVIMIEYFSQACTACAEFDISVFPLLKAKYIDSGKVRFVLRPYPLFPIDGPAYRLDRCVPRERFFTAVDVLFRRQAEWDNGEYHVTDPHGALIRIAQSLGLSAKQADDCMKSTKLDAAINRQAAEAQARYDPTDTPTFVINFVKDENGVGWDDIQTALDSAIAAKRAQTHSAPLH